MHIYFSGIGGTAISALAVLAKETGHDVSGSDARDSQYLEFLRKKGINDVHVGLTRRQIEAVHAKTPIDWFVYGSAQPIDFPDNPEFGFCKEKGIKMSKRDEFLNDIIATKKLKLVAIAGTHGKTTTTAMAIWLFKQLGLPISYSVGAKISFGEMSLYDPKSQYFVYECDEFDRNFLAFHPYISIISGVSWDHHEIFPTKADYLGAFKQFIDQSQSVTLWDEDAKILDLLSNSEKSGVEATTNPNIEKISLAGLYNRRDAWLVISALAGITSKSPDELIDLMNRFPGVNRRHEKIADNLYSDYAHTPEKIAGAMSVAKELTDESGQKLVVIYEPLTNRRMHFMKDQHKEIFKNASKLYWVPSFLAREDPSQAVLTPAELITHLDEPTKAIATPMELNSELLEVIKQHQQNGDMVLALSGGGTGSLDEWLRKNFTGL